jgi:beta-1,4-mannosyl-glycoprotein beta-1,4-N-acetylglucosaminyltransferase
MIGLEAELSILEIRFRELYPIIDYFVVVESNLSHSGRPKEFFFLNNAKRFESYLHKIIYVQSDLSKETTDWRRENKQRNDILIGIKNLELEKSDLILISDLDEIPDSNIVPALDKLCINSPISFNHRFFAYFLNLKGMNKQWIGTVGCKREWLDLHPPQFFRNFKDSFPRIDGEAGWHFSYCGGVEAVHQKLKAFAHQENPFKNLSSESFEELFKNRVLKDKQFCFDNDSTPLEKVDIDDSFPEYIQTHKEELSRLILP